MKQPTPKQIASARARAGLTQREAAALVYSDIRSWQRWEAGDRAMSAIIWELFRIKIGEISEWPL